MEEKLIYPRLLIKYDLLIHLLYDEFQIIITSFYQGLV